MTDDKKAKYKIELSDEIRKKIAEDPEMAKAIEEFIGYTEIAKQLLDEGKASSFDEAMYMASGTRPEKIDPDELPDEVVEKIENAKFSKPN